MTRRRWIADTWTATTATLAGDQAQHLARVLRTSPGTECDIVAGGFVFHARVNSVEEHEVTFDLIAEIASEPALPVTLLLSVFKFDRMEWAIEKATELGVERIVPVIARRTERHLALAAAKRVERWRRIAREAAQQSRRSDTPQLDDPVALKFALQQQQAPHTDPINFAPVTPPLNIVLSEQEQSATLRRILEEANVTTPTAPHPAIAQLRLAIGPEGGWAPEEVEMFYSEGWKPATLGPRVLRAETAAISALSIVAALLT